MHTIDKMPLSLGQKELWFIHALGGKAKSAYNESIAYSIKGDLSIPALEKAYQALLHNHEMLRVSIDQEEDGSLFQIVHSHSSSRLRVVTNVDDTYLNKAVESEIETPFNLQNPSFIRATLFVISKEMALFVIVAHHIITDGSSFKQLTQDLSHYYNAYLQQIPVSSEEKQGSYIKHIHSEMINASSEHYQKNLAALAGDLKGYAGLKFLTTPHTQSQKDIFSGERVYFNFSTEKYRKIKSYSLAQRATVFHFLFSAYSLLLSQFARTQDVVVGIPFLNRDSELYKNCVGYFVNTLPVRLNVDNSKRFSGLLVEVKKRIFSYLGKQNVAFEHVARELNIERKAYGQHPLIQTLFVFADRKGLDLSFQGVKCTQETRFHAKTAKFDLSLFLFEDSQETLSGYFEYRDTIFDHHSITSIANGFQSLLNNILDDTDCPLSQISMIDTAEKMRMRNTLFTSKLDREVTTSLGELFSKTVSLYPQRTGLTTLNNHFEYQTIERRSMQWASYIRSQYHSLYGKPMPADTLVALCVDRNEDMIFGILGILKAGGAYVPVDPCYPKDRIDYILSHSQSALILTHRVHESLIGDFDAEKVIFMDDDTHQHATAFLNPRIDHRVHSKDLAYVLYTSGSTGKPKGVGVTHENVICLFESLKSVFELNCKDVWALFHTFSFDISVWEIWGAFLFGGRLVVIPFDISRDPKKFYSLIEKEQVTVLTQTPSAFQMFINEDLQHAARLSHLRYVAFVGESLKVSILRPWVAKNGVDSPRLANMYGITETTVYTNYKFISETDIERGRDNIGWPLEEFSMCILDNNLQWCPIGIVGEICIGGRGLSRGYLYRDDLTAEKFILDPYREFLGLSESARLYKTGDLGRWLEDGSIEYLGRKDFQIKLRGFRIELGEIEASLGSYKGISHTAVLLKGEGDSAYLAAYYTVSPGSQIHIEKLISHMKSFLPEHMIPKTYTELPAFPMTVNGKVDRSLLFAHTDQALVTNDHQPLMLPLEHQIALIWSSLLSIDPEKIGRTSNFFELGGNSLLVIKMLSVLKKQTGLDITLAHFIAAPTITSLVGLSINSQAKSQNSLRQRMDQDKILDNNIKPLELNNPHSREPKVILLTGATGFLGAHMLSELLKTSNAEIYCLLRSESLSAKDRLISKLSKYHLACQDAHKRIHPIHADLNAPRLGLSEKDYHFLTQEVDAVFHVGAWVHHIFDYDTLYQSNVGSLLEFIKMATSFKNKAIHFISTLGTHYISDNKHPMQSDLIKSNGYLTTKWVAEQLVKQANDRGIDAHIYRPGNIISGATGISEPNSNHTLLRLKGMLQLKKAYIDPSEPIEMMPVDLLTSSILHLARTGKQVAYNLNNPLNSTWGEYLTIAKSLGFRFKRIIDRSTWNNILEELNESNALYTLRHVYQNHYHSEEQHDINQVSITSNLTVRTPSYQTMMKKQILALIEDGFLENPNKVSSTTD